MDGDLILDSLLGSGESGRFDSGSTFDRVTKGVWGLRSLVNQDLPDTSWVFN